MSTPPGSTLTGLLPWPPHWNLLPSPSTPGQDGAPSALQQPLPPQGSWPWSPWKAYPRLCPSRDAPSLSSSALPSAEPQLLFPLRASQRDLAVLMVPGQTLCLVLVVLVNSSVARGRPRPSWVSAEALGRGGRRRAEMLGVGGWMDTSAGPSSGPRAPSASAGRGPPSGSRGPTQSWKGAGQTPRSPSLSTGSFGARRKDFLMTSSP